MNQLGLLFLMLILSSCSLLQRHPDSGFGNSLNDKPTSPAGSEFESGEHLASHQRLKILENSLNTRREIEQYTKALPYFTGLDERLEFLSLPSVEARNQWIIETDLYGRFQREAKLFDRVAAAQDIALGMTETYVRKAWGEPTTIEVSGQSRYKNFRWQYRREVATSDGFIPEKRTVYFEAGRVVGWEKE